MAFWMDNSSFAEHIVCMLRDSICGSVPYLKEYQQPIEGSNERDVPCEATVILDVYKRQVSFPGKDRVVLFILDVIDLGMVSVRGCLLYTSSVGRMSHCIVVRTEWVRHILE